VDDFGSAVLVNVEYLYVEDIRGVPPPKLDPALIEHPQTTPPIHSHDEFQVPIDVQISGRHRVGRSIGWRRRVVPQTLTLRIKAPNRAPSAPTVHVFQCTILVEIKHGHVRNFDVEGHKGTEGAAKK
jgi:hypothetical protein